jgi:uncharacterized protein YqeY
MDLIKKLNDDIKSSMLSKNKERLTALRDIKSKVLLESTSGKGELSPEMVGAICLKLHKQRMETYQLYQNEGREDLASEELFQAKVIEDYLPKMMNEDEVEELIDKTASEINANGMKDMGRMMGILSGLTKGKFDGKTLSEMVKSKLQG